MSRTATVFFDGVVLRPEEPLEIEPNKRYVITLEDVPPAGGIVWNLLEKLAGTNEAPPDRAEKHDHYTRGTPKHGSGHDR
jgi:hypothetical protein